MTPDTDNHDSPDAAIPLTDAATVDDIAAAAERHRQAAELAAGHAERDRAEAEAIMSAAQEEAARIIAAAEAKTRPLSESAAVAERAAGKLGSTAERLNAAAHRAAKAEASEGHVQALEDERAELAATLADLGRRRAELVPERVQAAAQLEDAREAADLDAIAAHRNRLASIDDLAAVLTSQEAPVQTRLEAIGDGSLSPVWPQKELYEARQSMRATRRSTRDALNLALPDRPEAVAAAARQREAEQEGYDRERDAARAAERDRAAFQARPRQVEQSPGQVIIRR